MDEERLLCVLLQHNTSGLQHALCTSQPWRVQAARAHSARLLHAVAVPPAAASPSHSYQHPVTRPIPPAQASLIDSKVYGSDPNKSCCSRRPLPLNAPVVPSPPALLLLLLLPSPVLPLSLLLLLPSMLPSR